jgi:glutathione S-transferase
LRMYYSDRYSAGGEADAPAVRRQATEDYIGQLTLASRALGPYLLGATFSVADVYLYMLVTWFTGERDELFRRVPTVRAHAELLAQRPSIQKVDAEHL